MTDLFDDIEIEPVPDPPVQDEDQDQRPETDTVVNLPQCEVCGTPIEWSGRGRRPKKCSEHRTRTTPRDASGAPITTRRNAKQEARLEQLANDLTLEAVAFGKGLSMALPTTGVVIVERSEGTARALVRVAQDNPKVLAALETVGKIAPVGVIGETGLKVGTALLVDLGRIEPDSFLPKMTGVSAVWHEIHDDKEPSAPEPMGYNGVGLPPVSVPPRFQQVSV